MRELAWGSADLKPDTVIRQVRGEAKGDRRDLVRLDWNWIFFGRCHGTDAGILRKREAKPGISSYVGPYNLTYNLSLSNLTDSNLTDSNSDPYVQGTNAVWLGNTIMVDDASSPRSLRGGIHYSSAVLDTVMMYGNGDPDVGSEPSGQITWGMSGSYTWKKPPSYPSHY